MGRKALRTGVVVTLQLVVSLCVVEGTLRLVHPHHEGLRILLYSPTVATEYDAVDSTEELLETSVLGFKPYRPSDGFVRNSRGFRTPEYRPDKPPGVYRIVVLGDSFTHSSSGVPWSWMWPTEAGRHLETLTGRPVEIINLGVPAVGPRFELRLWELEGARLDPDLVVLGFFVGNDLTDESGRPLTGTREETLARLSYTYRLGRNLLRLARQRLAAGESWPEPPPARGRYRRGGFELPDARERYDPRRGWFQDEDAFLRMERNRLRLCRTDLGDELDELMSGVEPVLVRLHRQVRRHGAELVVMLIPDQYQVEPPLLERVVARFGIPRRVIDLDRPQQRLRTLLEREGALVFDPRPILVREAARRPLYKPMDTHWNAAGNRLVGRRLAEFLAAHDLPPAVLR